MKGFSDALAEGFTLEPPGQWVFRFGDGYQLCFEPMIGGGWFVALYQHIEGEAYPELLLADKVPVEAGYDPTGGIAYLLALASSMASDDAEQGAGEQ